MKKKYLAYSVLFLSAVGLVGCINNGDEANDSTPETEEVSNEAETTEVASESEAQYTTEINQELIDEHENRYQDILETFQGGQYPMEEPLVVQNPYSRAPLTALVLFETEEPMEITVTVEGRTEETTISHTSTGFNTEHEIQVLGLYPDMENQVTLVGETENDEITEVHLSMSTDPVPEEMLDFTLETSKPDKMHPGLTFVSPSRSYPAGVDNNGDVRWYSSIMTYNQFIRLDNGKLLMATLEENREDYDHLTEADMLGRVHQSITIDMENVLSSSPLHHDVIILPNDNYLALLHDGSDEYVEDEIVELDRDTGEVVHRINLKDVFPREMYEEYDGHQADVGDWLHVNAVWKLKNEEALLLSARQQDMILKLTYPDGEIDWIFAHPEDWDEELEDYLLETTDDELKFPAGQHAVRELPDQDGDESTLDIILFDNNRVFTRGSEEESGEYSQAIQYRINQENNTVEEIWSYGKERGNDLYSNLVSNAIFLPETENVLINFGRTLNEEVEERYSVITEVTKTEDPEVVYELNYGPFGVDEYSQIYRAERFPLYPEN